MSNLELYRDLGTYNDGWRDQEEEGRSAYRAHLAHLVRRGRRDAVGGALAFWPLDQPYNLSAEYAAWRRGYDRMRRLIAARNAATPTPESEDR